MALVSALVLVLTGYAWYTLSDLNSGLNKTDVLATPGGLDGAVDILLVGSDSRTDAHGNPLSQEMLRTLRASDNEGELTDTLILVRIPKDGRSATAISIPRDSYVQIPGGYGKHKINSAYARAKNSRADELEGSGDLGEQEIEKQATKAGRQTLVRTVEGLTGASIDHFAEVNLLGFYLVSKAVGGVDVCLRKDTTDRSSGAQFDKGVQTISGSDALAFVRQRKNLPRGDLDRVVRQQVFMAGMADKVLSTGTLTSPKRLDQLVEAVQRSVVLDKDLEILTFARQLQGMAAGRVKFATIPTGTASLETESDGLAVKVTPEKVQDFVRDLAGVDGNQQQAAVEHGRIAVNVQNAVGTPGLAGAVEQHLAEQEFGQGEVGNAEARSASVVHYSPGQQSYGQEVASALGGLPTEEDSELGAGTVEVFLGADYSGPGTEGEQQTSGKAAGTAPAAVGQTRDLAQPTTFNDPNESVGGSGQSPQPSKDPIVADDVPCVN